MGVRTFEDRPAEPVAPLRGPGLAAALIMALPLLLVLLANGRPIGVGDTGGVAGLLMAPFVAASGLVVDVDDRARALAGKLAASVFAALAAAILFAAVAHRRPTTEAGTAALLLALGSSLWAASHSFSAHAPAAAAVALAVLFLVRAEDEPVWAPRAGLPLSLAVALLPATAALALVVAGAVAVRWPGRVLRLALWALPGLLLLAGQAALGLPAPSGLGPFATPGANALAMLVSPARGALVFTPVAFVALIGLMSALRRDRWLPAILGLAFVAHCILALSGTDGAPSWGCLALTAAWPVLFLFLPEGLDATRMAGVALAVLSVAIQALGAFTYDGRWDRLFRGESGRITSPWNIVDSPIVWQIRQRVVHLAVPAIVDRHAIVRDHILVLGASEGSRVTFAGEGPLLTGSDATLGDVVLEGGARVRLDTIALRSAGDGIFLRLRDGARQRRLELRVLGRGRGTLAVSEASFWSVTPRMSTEAVSGDFRIRHPYSYPESGGGDLRVTLQSGNVEIRALSLVPPGDGENVIRLH
jgi:hypothetical protein